MNDLLSKEGRTALRRHRRRDFRDRYHWPLVCVGAAGVGVANYIGLIFAGLGVRDSLVIAAGLTVLLIAANVL